MAGVVRVILLVAVWHVGVCRKLSVGALELGRRRRRLERELRRALPFAGILLNNSNLLPLAILACGGCELGLGFGLALRRAVGLGWLASCYVWRWRV